MSETNLLIAAVLLLMAGLLLYARRRSKSLSGFLVSERSLGGVVSAFTYSTAAVSAGLFIGGAGFAYTYGWAGATYQLGALSGIFLTWLLIAPRVRKMASAVGALSTPNFLAERFECPSFRTVTSALTIVFVLPMIVVQFRGAGLLFENYLGLDYERSVIVFGLLVGLFTALGGNFAVSYLSTILGTLMVIGSVACIGSGLSQVGGLQNMNAQLAARDANFVRFVGRVPWPVWWDLLVIFGLAQFSNPHLIPRFFSLRDSQAVRLALPLSMFINCLWVCAAVLIGLVARVQYPGLSSGDQAMPVFMRSLSPAVSSLILIALVSAIFTTIDTLLLAVGSNISHDLIKGLFWSGLSERGELWLTRLAIVVVGAIGFSFSLLDLPLITLINSFAIGAFILILGLPLIMGIFFRRATKEAALTSAIGGSVLYLVWKYFLVSRTGIGEMIASLVIIIPTSMIVSWLTRQAK
jgi:sodium/pantothenate symporter